MEINEADKQLRFRLILQWFSYCQVIISYYKNIWLNTNENPDWLNEHSFLNFHVIFEKWI